VHGSKATREPTAARRRLLAFSLSHVRDGFVGVSIGSSAFTDFDRSSITLDAWQLQERSFVHPDAGFRRERFTTRLVGV
jgi:hypothetical protein